MQLLDIDIVICKILFLRQDNPFNLTRRYHNLHETEAQHYDRVGAFILRYSHNKTLFRSLPLSSNQVS